MIEELLKVGGSRFLIPCVLAILFVTLAKGLFGVHQSRRVARKDFLDVWSHQGAHDELWRQVAVRHLFGEWLPVSVIQVLLESSQSGRALVEISSAWDLLEIDDKSHTVSWKANRHRKPSSRRSEARLLTALYFILGVPAVLAVFYILVSAQDGMVMTVLWMLAIELVILALACLIRGEDLKAANAAVPRWLGLP